MPQRPRCRTVGDQNAVAGNAGKNASARSLPRSLLGWSKKKAEAEKIQAENEEQQERARNAYAREMEREHQVANARSDQLWREHEQNRFDYNCSKLTAQGQQGQGCPAVNK